MWLGKDTYVMDFGPRSFMKLKCKETQSRIKSLPVQCENVLSKTQNMVQLILTTSMQQIYKASWSYNKKSLLDRLDKTFNHICVKT